MSLKIFVIYQTPRTVSKKITQKSLQKLCKSLQNLPQKSPKILNQIVDVPWFLEIQENPERIPKVARRVLGLECRQR